MACDRRRKDDQVRSSSSVLLLEGSSDDVGRVKRGCETRRARVYASSNVSIFLQTIESICPERKGEEEREIKKRTKILRSDWAQVGSKLIGERKGREREREFSFSAVI